MIIENFGVAIVLICPDNIDMVIPGYSHTATTLVRALAVKVELGSTGPAKWISLLIDYGALWHQD